MPMWGYGDRHDMLSEGITKSLFAKAIVISAADQKVALVGLDIGRGPTQAMMKAIRVELAEKAGIQHVMISGTHTHHGPVIELLDREGYGKGRFDAAVEYNKKLPEWIAAAILAADKNLQPARIGVGTKQISANRNRHSKRIPKAIDNNLLIIRFDVLAGNETDPPIAILVNYAAHPTMIRSEEMKFSPDYPGYLEDKVETDLNTNCVFMQGASGDMSTSPPQGIHGPQSYGELLASYVVELAQTTATSAPKKPEIPRQVDDYQFQSRIDFNNPLVAFAFGKAFFPELIRCFTVEFKEGIHAQLNTILLNQEIALVGGSGEFFCNHGLRLKQRSYVPHTLFFGYCNGHHLYFPTIEALSLIHI